MLRFGNSVRPDERAVTFTALFTLFGFLTGHTILETARDTLFLTSLPATRLPWVYLAIAAVSLGIAWSQQHQGSRTAGARSLAGLLAGGSLLAFVFWLLMGSASNWILYALYIWSGVFATLAVVQFWSLLQDRFTVTQAKRLFAIVGTGGVLGGILGAAIARLITAFADPRHLLLASGIVTLASVIGVLRLGATPVLDATPEKAATRTGSRVTEGWMATMLEPAKLVGSRPYLKRLALLVLVSTIALTIVDYLFKSAVARLVEPRSLGSFFATTYLVLNLISLAVQMFVTGWLTRAFGVSRVLVVLPICLALGTVGLVAGGGLVAALVLKGFDGAFRHSIHRTTLEVLYVPMPAEIRSRVKGFVDVIGQRGGQALASIAILGLVAVGVEPLVAGVLLVIVAVWIALAAALKPHYLELFRLTLRESTVASRMAFPSLDLASLETLIGALSSQSDSEVIAALDLLEEQGRAKLVPALILYHPSPAVVRRALRLFTDAGRDDYLPIAERLVGHLDPQVRAGILRARTSEKLDVEILEQGLEDPSTMVRATAVAGLVAVQGCGAPAVAKTLDDLLSSVSSDGRLALGSAIADRPDPVCEWILLKLADDTDLRVRREAARAMPSLPSPEYPAALIRMLDRRELRQQARRSLRAMGPGTMDELERGMASRVLKRAVRLHLPRTIGEFDPDVAAGILTTRLPDEPDGAIRFKIIRTLVFLKTQDADVAIPREMIERTISETVTSAFELIDWQLRLEAGAVERSSRRSPVHDLLTSLLAHKEEHAIDRLFRLLFLLPLREDFRRIHRGIGSRNAKVHSGSRELIESELSSPLREAVLALTDDLPARERLAVGTAYYTSEAESYDAILGSLLVRGGTTAQNLVIHHIGELELVAFRERLRQLSLGKDPIVNATLEHALERLDLVARQESARG